MRKENGMPTDGRKKEKDEEKVTRSYDNSSYVRKEGSWHYVKESVEGGAYMNVEGMVIEYDEGLEGDTVGGKDLATMNKF